MFCSFIGLTVNSWLCEVCLSVLLSHLIAFTVPAQLHSSVMLQYFN
uniref:Uncharacterized protein n=1 Tax=Rhizophora mucronata TaxID=61149 RepID=A0A2P2PWJ3_RHIMU